MARLHGSLAFVFVLVIAVGVAGCVQYVADPAARPTLKNGSSVALGIESVASIGSPMLIEYRYQASEAAVTTSPFSRGLFNAEISIPAGLPLTKVQRNSTTCYLTSAPVKRIFFGGPRAEQLCLVDHDGGGVFTLALPTSAAIDVGVGYDVNVPYQMSEVTAPGGYKHEVVYEGAAANTLRIQYRRFSRNLQQPESVQELTFAIEPGRPTEFSVLNAHFVVMSTDNNGVRYKVTRYFENN